MTGTEKSGIIKAMTKDLFKVAVDKISNHHAVLDCGRGQTLTVACRFLPANIKEGDIVALDFLSEKQATMEREEMAKQILKEILKIE
ncbi:MAG: hypothetical protein CEN88_448 [Candidatus Berkelbacteria bacterium Licking1014_2]|uniref:DUF3006 domain-containing protein n=1 Tax=Candidatus Berkelbacteria bacterium Licking1014_2 TaxID=2017146 RepID=A0A554LS16_9BACT|nr:MAG: hypothetical protein CEN88_448 [Candidatus Berkelbacteria bacterium Licking1014_2]